MSEIFIQRLKSKRLSAKTIELYRTEIRTLQGLGRNKEAIEFHLSGCAPSTHARKLIMWKAYLKSIRDKLLDSFEVPRVPKKQISFLLESEIKILEAYSEGSLDREDRIFIEIGIGLGLRISEILQVNKHRVHGEWVSIIRKGGNEQRLPLTESLQLKLQSFEGFTRSKRHFQKMMHRTSKACGFHKKITPHTLRHTFATRAISENNDIATIKEALGHSSLQSTEKYLHVTPERLMKMMRRK